MYNVLMYNRKGIDSERKLVVCMKAFNVFDSES